MIVLSPMVLVGVLFKISPCFCLQGAKTQRCFAFQKGKRVGRKRGLNVGKNDVSHTLKKKYFYQLLPCSDWQQALDEWNLPWPSFCPSFFWISLLFSSCDFPLRWPESRESIRRFARIAWFARSSRTEPLFCEARFGALNLRIAGLRRFEQVAWTLSLWK